ncbi:MAG: Fe-S cluster assembly protein SufB, partial [Ilumatobacter sp.]|nr:Fe-S cluster assembly protein SufB [Ilumatobacter sp.]
MKGINARVVGQISLSKAEPEWMEQLRLRSLSLFGEQPMAEWFAVNMPDIDFQDIDEALQSGDARRDLAGNTALPGSEAVGPERRADLEEQGVLFCDM